MDLKRIAKRIRTEIRKAVRCLRRTPRGFREARIVDLTGGEGAYCISLPGDTRRESFEIRAREIGQKFQWWDGVDGRGKSRKEMEALAGRPILWDMEGNRDALRRTTEAGVIIASISLWQKAWDDGLEHLVVMEDDAWLYCTLKVPVPEDADMVFFNDRSFSDRDGKTCGAVCGADGYLVTRKGLAKLLEIHREAWMPVDLQMIPQIESLRKWGHPLSRYYNNKLPSIVAYTFPPIVFHGYLPSRICYSDAK